MNDGDSISLLPAAPTVSAADASVPPKYAVRTSTSSASSSFSSASPLPRKRRYETWKGRNVFLCNGMLIMGPHWRYLVLTLFLLTLSWVIYLACVAPLLQDTLYYLIALILWSINTISLCLTSFTEPGIVPRRQDNVIISSMQLEINQKVYNYCNICHIVRAPRTKHCRLCDSCIEGFDHHCPWTGTCIGIRNYSYFFVFISSVFITSIYIMASIARIFIGWFVFGMTTNVYFVRGFLCPIFGLWGLLVFILIGLLLIFHIYLVIHGQTTHEFLRTRRTPSTASNCSKKRCVGSTNNEPRSHSKRSIPPFSTQPSPIDSLSYSQRSIWCSTIAIFCEIFCEYSRTLKKMTTNHPSLLLPLWQIEDATDEDLDIANAQITLTCLRNAL